MLRTILLSVFMVSALSLTTVTNTFPGIYQTAITYGPIAVAPQYPISVAATVDNITVHMRLSNAPVGMTNNLGDITLQFQKASAAGAAAVGTGSLAFTNGLTSQTLTGIFLSDPAVTLKVSTSVATAKSNVNVYELEVRINGTSRLRVADMLRGEPRTYYFLKNNVTNYTYSLTQTTAAAAGSGASLKVNNMPLFGQFGVGTVDATTINMADGTNSYTQILPGGGGNLTRGYYYVMPSWITPDKTATVTYSTDEYPCPYDGAFYDYYGTFKGCTPASSGHQAYVIRAHGCGSRQFFNGICQQVDASCNNFDPLSGACLTCWENSRPAVRGSCTTATGVTGPVCPTGKRLFNNAICIPEECSAANIDGTCSACINSAFVLTNGACIPVNCGTGSYFSVAAGQCVLLPTRCLAVSPLTQLCTKCVNGYFPDSTGVCTSPCPTGQFYVNNNGRVNGIETGCYTLPPNCVSLTNVLHCDACTANYRPIQGECRLCSGPNPNYPCSTCPITGQFVNSNGQCVTQAQNCATIDQTSGLCLTCANGLPTVNGVCCLSGQSVQANGLCGDGSSGSSTGSGVQVDFNVYHKYCKVYSPPLSKCIECLNARSFIPNSDRCQ